MCDDLIGFRRTDVVVLVVLDNVVTLFLHSLPERWEILGGYKDDLASELPAEIVRQRRVSCRRFACAESWENSHDQCIVRGLDDGRQGSRHNHPEQRDDSPSLPLAACD